MSNSTSVAGIVHLPESMVSLGDGISELVLVKEPATVADFAYLANAVLLETFDSDKLIIRHTKKAVFHFDRPVAWTRDGEAGGEYRDITLCNYPKSNFMPQIQKLPKVMLPVLFFPKIKNGSDMLLRI
jgi:hypothetical protein